MKRKSSRRLGLAFSSGERQRPDRMCHPWFLRGIFDIIDKFFRYVFDTFFSTTNGKHSYNTRFPPKIRFHFQKCVLTMENSTYVTTDEEFGMIIKTLNLRQFKNKFKSRALSSYYIYGIK